MQLRSEGIGRVTPNPSTDAMIKIVRKKMQVIEQHCVKERCSDKENKGIVANNASETMLNKEMYPRSRSVGKCGGKLQPYTDHMSYDIPKVVLVSEDSDLLGQWENAWQWLQQSEHWLQYDEHMNMLSFGIWMA